MEIEDAIHTAILTLKEGLDGELTEDLIEVGISKVEIIKDRDGVDQNVDVFRKLSLAEVKDYLANIV